MTAAAIRCQGLVKRYPPEVVAVDGLSLQVERGECFGLLGPNGAGKTTTIEILEGLLVPTAGEVEVLGMRWDRDATALRQRLGVTLQETHLDDRLTVFEILSLFRSFYPKSRDIAAVLALVSLQEKRNAWYEKLSGGQKQRLAVACALVSEPELLFLDEPTTGLDPQSRRQLWDVVSEVRADGRTVVLSTHYMDEAERLCDRVAIVDQGKVIALGTPRALIAELVGDDIVEFSTAAGEAASASSDGSALTTGELQALAGVTGVRASAQGWALTVEAIHIAVPALLARLQTRGLRLAQLSTHSATLEDVFLTLTGRHLRD